MREIKRIKRICKKLEQLWHYFPDQRLGQLLENYVFGHHIDTGGCIFNHEDDEIEIKLNTLLFTLKHCALYPRRKEREI